MRRYRKLRAAGNLLRTVLGSLAVTTGTSLAWGQETCAKDPAACGASVDACLNSDACGETLFGSIEPLTCSRLTGDWFGVRPQIEDSGVTFDASVANFYTSVVDGGVDRNSHYAGHGDYVANIDGDKLLGLRGMFVTLRAEHRFGDSMANNTGAFLPSVLAANLPGPETDDVRLTNVLVTQMFSETFGVFAGKLNSLDGDQNAFASGRGVTQFSNMAFVGTPIGLRTIPYATLGAGFVVLQDLKPVFTFAVMDPHDTSNRTGFSELFRDGAVVVPELRLPTEFFGLPGHQLFGATWSSRNYTSLDQDPRIVLPPVPIQQANGSWSLYYNFDQHLVVDPHDSSRGWGLFGRAGIADEKTNPIGWILSAGLGGNSPINGRGQDTFGAGYFYSGTSSQVGPILSTALGPVGDGYGTELFYNVEVTKWFHLTADAQFITPAREDIDSSVLLGLRGVVTF